MPSCVRGDDSKMVDIKEMTIDQLAAELDVVVQEIVETKKTVKPTNIAILDLEGFELLGYDEEGALEYVSTVTPKVLDGLKAKGYIGFSADPVTVAAQKERIERVSGILKRMRVDAGDKKGTGVPRDPGKQTNFKVTLSKKPGITAQDLMFEKLKDVDPTLAKDENGNYVGEKLKIHSYDAMNGRLTVAYKKDGTWGGYTMNNPGSLADKIKVTMGLNRGAKKEIAPIQTAS